jgi:hypothetical protein
MLKQEAEDNINKVLEWFDEEHSRYPAVGSNSIVVAQKLGVMPSEVNIANRRIALGLRTLKTIKKKPLKDNV